MQKLKTIYSLRVMEQLAVLGYTPIASMPNPKDEKFLCWIFEVTPEFERDVDLVLGGISHG